MEGDFNTALAIAIPVPSTDAEDDGTCKDAIIGNSAISISGRDFEV